MSSPVLRKIAMRRRRPKRRTQKTERDTMAVGSGTMLSLSVGFFPLSFGWKDGRGAAPPHRNRILLGGGGVGLTAAPK